MDVAERIAASAPPNRDQPATLRNSWPRFPQQLLEMRTGSGKLEVRGRLD